MTRRDAGRRPSGIAVGSSTALALFRYATGTTVMSWPRSTLLA